MNVDRCWEQYYKTLKLIYLEENKETCQREIDHLVDTAIELKEKTYSNAVLDLGRQFREVCPKARIMWKTSSIAGNFYPPISISDIYSPVIANVFDQTTRLECRRQEYSLRMPLQEEPNFTGIQQHAQVSDCSLVVSLININRYKTTMPVVKQVAENLYATNLYFNGAQRRLVLVSTENIPTMQDDPTKQMSVHSANKINKILELGLLKLTSLSYHSEGSNTAIDTYRLCGWIPDISSINEFNFLKVHKAFSRGECLIAMGTGGFVPKENIFGVKLRKYHDYAVLNIDMINEVVTLRDPLISDTLLTINFDSIRKYFLQVYCNWDSSKLFMFTKDTQIFYSDKKFNPYQTLAGKPTFYLKNNSDRDEYAWVLLEFHLDKNNNTTAYLQEIPDRISTVRLGYNDNSAETGFQLIKIRLKPKQCIWYFCYSSTDKMLTFHTYSTSSDVVFVRSKMPGCDFDVTECAILPENIVPMQYPNHSETDIYYLASIDFSIEGEPGITIITDMVVCLETDDDLVNFQMFHWDDLDFNSPIYDEFYMNERMFEKKDLPLTSGERYRIVASTARPPISKGYQCAVSGINIHADYPCSYKLRESDVRYNSMMFKLPHVFTLASTGITKISLVNRNKYNKVFMRIYPQTQEDYRYNYRVISADTGEDLVKPGNNIQKLYGGIVIKEFLVSDQTNLELHLSFQDNGRVPVELKCQLYVGSVKIITLS